MGAFDDVPTVTVPSPDDPKAAAAFRKKWGWEPHEQVILKGCIDVSDQEYTANLFGKAGKAGKVEIQMGAGRYALLDRMIIAWTLTGNGKPVPLSPANIRKLTSHYSTPILEVIDEIASPMTEEEQEDFLPSVSGPIVESSASESLLPMTS